MVYNKGGLIMESNVLDVLKHYKDFDKLKSFGEYGNGHINDTYLIEYEGNNKIILQKVNKNIFKEPKKLMDFTCDIISKRKNY